MERIISCNERKVFLILDNLRVHHSKLLDDFLREHAAFIKVFHLPSYSPDLNPDEYLNRDTWMMFPMIPVISPNYFMQKASYMQAKLIADTIV